MISTINTSTLAYSGALADSVTLIVVLLLFVLLVQKELAISSSDLRLKRLSLALNVPLFPMLVAFLVIVIFRVAEVLR